MKPTANGSVAILLGFAIVGIAGTASSSAFYSQLRSRPSDPELLESGDLIRYATLSRDDFQAAKPPADVIGPDGRLGAAACVMLTTGPDAHILSGNRGIDLKAGQFWARVKNLWFVAYLDRGCSWWNPTSVSLPADYVLRHEQIHFALFEIAARQLNGRAERLMKQFETRSTDQRWAVDEVRRLIDTELQKAMDEVRARTDDFDQETSRTYREHRQNWWWRSITEELERLPATGLAR